MWFWEATSSLSYCSCVQSGERGKDSLHWWVNSAPNTRTWSKLPRMGRRTWFSEGVVTPCDFFFALSSTSPLKTDFLQLALHVSVILPISIVAISKNERFWPVVRRSTPYKSCKKNHLVFWRFPPIDYKLFIRRDTFTKNAWKLNSQRISHKLNVRNFCLMIPTKG